MDNILYNDLLKVIKEYPDCHIDYIDNGEFSLYKKDDWSNYERTDDQKYLRVPLYNGSDSDGEGYIPFLLQVIVERCTFMRVTTQ